MLNYWTLLNTFFLSFLSPYNINYKEPESSGCIIVKYYAASLGEPSKRMTLPDDSIFYVGNKAIEKVDGIFDSEKNGAFVRSVKTQVIYFLDFASNKRIELNNSLHILSGKKWIGLDSFKTGMDFRYEYYNGERYTEKDTIIGKEKMYLIRYISQKGHEKGSVISVIFSPKLNRPAFFKNLEVRFQRAIRRIEIVGGTGNGASKTVLDFEERKLSEISPEVEAINDLSRGI